MATFSVADLTAKSKKTMSKNDKKVIDKYKITSAYESKKGLNQKKRETAKEIYNECGTIRKMLISSINTVKKNAK